LVTKTVTKSATVNDQPHSFGYWLRLKRKALDLTREGLADQVGCSAATIRKLEAEERRPSAQIVARLATIFAIPPNEEALFLRFARGELSAAPAGTRILEPWQVADKPPRTNLPAPPSVIIGREEEIKAISGLIMNPKIRLVTLLGPPGIGKTHLSLEAAHQLLPDFLDGVFFVSLAALDHHDLIAPAILQALSFVGLKNQSDLERIKEGIGDKKILLVLDNLEHLIQGSAALVVDLLLACPQIKILTTSREALRAPGEWLFPVPALRFPIQSQVSLESLGVASRYPALALFVERARAVRPDFALTAENLAPISEICMRLDGLPLAIELIAARIRLLSAQDLLNRMSSQFILNMDGFRAVPTRLKTLHHAIGWSYDLLSEEEKHLFAYLSVFSGGFTLEGVERAFEHTSFHMPVADLITSLLDKSLIQRSPGPSSQSRFNMLATIQEFASERLHESGEETAIRDLYLAFFLQLAENADREIHGPNQIQWLNRLEMEHNNFRSAVDWSMLSHKTECALRLLVALGWAWGLESHYSEARSWFDRLSILPDVNKFPKLYGQLLLQIATNSWTEGDFRQADVHLEECQSIFLALGSAGERSLAQTLYLLGMTARWGRADVSAAKSLFEQSFKLYRKNDDRWGIAQTTFLLAILEQDQGHETLALSMFENSLDLFQQLGDLWGIARLSQHLGELYLKLGSAEKAISFFHQHLKIDEDLKFKEGTAVALRNLGNFYRYQGDYAQAEQYYDKSLTICREYDLKDDMSKNLFYLGLLALHHNDYELAAWYFIHNYRSLHTVNEKKSECDLLTGMAAVAAGTNQPERAAKLSGATQAILKTMDLPYQPYDRAEFDRHMFIARDQLGEAIYEALAKEGYAMSPEQAVSFTLS
jgi:predicted ATPase/DNA-binding XRE family transcriptional regulator